MEEQPVPSGTEFIVLAAGEHWLRLERGVKPVRIPRELGKPFPQRSELGDLDPKFWAVFADKPSDPWTDMLELLLVERKTNRLVLFQIGTITGKPCIEDLCRIVTNERDTRGPRAKPIIALKVGMVPTKNGPIPIPQFEIVGWVDGVEPETVPSKLAADLTAVLEKRSVIDPSAKRTGANDNAKGVVGKQKRRKEPVWTANTDELDDENPF